MTTTVNFRGNFRPVFPTSTFEDDTLPPSATTMQSSTGPVSAYEPWSNETAIKSSRGILVSTFLAKEAKACIRLADDVDFEDGVDNAFRQQMFDLIRRYGSSIVDTISSLITSGDISTHIAAEILHCLGDIEHRPSFRSRVQALGQGLRHHSVRVRDGAVLGLALMNHPATIPELRRALSRERVAELRADMHYLLSRLKELQ